MQRRIDLLDKHYSITISGQSCEQYFQVDESRGQPAALTIKEKHLHRIQLGDQQADLQLATKGSSVYIRAFGRTVTLNIVDPVEQAAQAAGTGSNIARAPMPGMVVKTQVSEGEIISKGQPMITIESMKTLTVITAPRDGKVSKVHFNSGDTFDKNATLITLEKKEET